MVFVVVIGESVAREEMQVQVRIGGGIEAIGRLRAKSLIDEQLRF